jgi:hypothetical protein
MKGRNDVFTPVLFHVAAREGYIGCECGTEVDLEDADDLNEAIELWNQHVRTAHKGE